jgi:hypothetical protein
MTELAR